MRPLLSFPLLATALLAMPFAARADVKPDFDEDAKPILRMQPGLLHYVVSTFDVKETGKAKFPGDDDHPARPPFIFSARPRGASGPFYIRLLIQPGPIGHILGVVDTSHLHPGLPPPSHPVVANRPPPEPVTPPSEPVAPVKPTPPTAAPSEPTSDTPSGPITDSGSTSTSSSGQPTPLPPPPNANSPSMEPVPDPAPSTH